MDLDEATYWELVDNLARKVMEAEQDGQNTEDALMEAIASYKWVTHNTRRALQVMIFSEYGDADLVTKADLSTVWRKRGLSGVASTIAYACLLGDVRERLERLRER